MKDIAIYTLTSELHNPEAVSQATKEFLDTLNIDFDFRGDDFSDFGCHTLNLIYVRTGGTEGIFKRLLPTLTANLSSPTPIYLLTSGKSNSLAASMEILAYLRQHAMCGEILHGNAAYITRRIHLLIQVSKAKRRVAGSRLGVIGKPSDWLIASHADYAAVRQKLGVEIVDIPMQELLDLLPHGDDMPVSSQEGALRIYEALRELVHRHRLDGFTLRCFDLLTAVRNTGCLALARLNAEGIIAGCEGDVPAMLSMLIVHSLTGVSGFQANPSSIDLETKRIILAHCTIPFNMVESYRLDTHFESGIGVGIHGEMTPGKVTIFKVSGTLDRFFLAEGQLVGNKSLPSLCRTQVDVELSTEQIHYFLTNPIGNHHVVLPGHQKALFEEFLNNL